jgi:hypothetical protein
VLLASAGRLGALPEDGGHDLTGEIEEAVEFLPDNPIPWHDSLLVLPGWMRQEITGIRDRTRPANQGGGLFPPQIWPLQPEPVQGPLILDSTLPGEGDPGLPLDAKAVVPLGPELMGQYTLQQPVGVWVDPQQLIQNRPGGQMESLVQRWLNDQCVFRTTLLVFGPGQQLPSDFDPQALRRQWAGETDDSLLVFYFYEQPERTLAIFGPGACATYTAAVLRSIVDASVVEAARVSGPTEQLERFCYKMSVRLHWLARSLPANLVDPGVSGNPSRRWWGNTAVCVAILSALGLAAGFGVVRLIRSRRPRSEGGADGPVFLPETEPCPRFGAPHSGGFSAVITFPRQSAP